MISSRRRSSAAAFGLTLVIAACSSSLTPSPGASAAGTPGPVATPTASVSAAPPTPSTSEPQPSGTSTATYVVRAGDTLSSIGRAWGATVWQLQAWNGERHPSLLTDPDRLEVGWELVVAGDPYVPSPAPTATGNPPAPGSVAPSAGGSGCVAGPRVVAGAQQTFTVVPGAGHRVALTLDMGGRLDPGLDILDLLIANHVCVTIFATGAISQTGEGQRILAVVRDHPELFEVGNHTMHHCDLAHGGGGSPTKAPCEGVTPTADFIRAELTDAEAIIVAASGQNSQPYWRAPFGIVNDAIRDAAASVGYTKTFGYDIDTADWWPISEGGPSAQQIATKVITEARDGSIVLMHLGGYETLDALTVIIPGLRDRGFGLTSLSDMLR